MSPTTTSPFRYKSRAARIEAYIDATREVAAYTAADRDEGPTPGRTRARLAARARQHEALREMNGGDLATAQRILLAARTAPQRSTATVAPEATTP